MSDVLSLFFVFQRPWHTDRVGSLFAVLCPSKRPWHGGRDWCLAAVLRPSKKLWQLLFSSSFYSSFWTLQVQMGNWAARKDEHSDRCLRSGDQGWRITATLAIKAGSRLSFIFNTQYHWPAGLQHHHWGSCFHLRSPTSTSWRTWEGRYCSVHQRKWGHILWRRNSLQASCISGWLHDLLLGFPLPPRWGGRGQLDPWSKCVNQVPISKVRARFRFLESDFSSEEIFQHPSTLRVMVTRHPFER